jgi:hypothetical protein
MEQESDAIWVSRIIQRAVDGGAPGHVIGNLFTVGAIPLVLTLLIFRLGGPASRSFVVAHSLLAIMLSAVGYLIWYYDTQLLAGFFDRLESLLANSEDFERMSYKYVDYFRDVYWKTLLVWTPVGPIAFVGNLQYFTGQGIGAPPNVTFWLYLLFAVWTTLLTGVGMHVILTTLLCVKEVSTLEFRIDPMHYDGLGGMSVIGDFAVWTMGLAAVGSLGIPFAFELASGGSMEWIVYVSLGAYLLSLAGVFIYPTVMASRQADELREDQIESYRQKVRTLDEELERLTVDDSPESSAVVAKELQRQRLQQKCEKLQAVKLYPVSIGVLSRFAGSILLPLLFILLEQFVPTFL